MAILDPTTLSLLYALATAVFAALIYTILSEFAADPNLTQPIDWDMFGANVIFGILVGIVAWISGVDVTAQWVGAQIATYGVFIFLLDKIITGIANRTISKSKFYARPVHTPANLRAKLIAGDTTIQVPPMSPDSQSWLTFDLPGQLQQPVLNCVAAAQAANAGMGTYLYAIAAGSFTYIIEDSELTASRHDYSIFGYFATASVVWKVISPTTLATARRTGFVPEYADLV